MENIRGMCEKSMSGHSDRRADLIRYGPVVLWALLIFVVSSIPNLSAPATRFRLTDKAAHFIEFGIFAYLLTEAFVPSGVKLARRRIGVVIAIGVLFSLLDEVHQSFVPGRDADFFDVLADVLGVCAAILVWHMLRQRRISLPP